MTLPGEGSRPDAETLSEDVAHRLLARAVELDAQRVDRVSIDELRDIAREVGISPHAFDDALAEVRKAALPQQRKSARERLRAVPVNVLPIVGYWGTVRLVDQVGLAYFPYPLVMLAGDIGITLGAAALALRLRGRWAALALSGLAAMQLAAYPIFYLGRTVPIGSPLAWLALGAAAFLGIGSGAIITTRLRADVDRDSRGSERASPTPATSQAHVATPDDRSRSLRLRHA